MRQVSAGAAVAPAGSMSRPSTRIVGEPGKALATASSSVRTSRTSTGATIPRSASTASSSARASGWEGQPSQYRNSIFMGLSLLTATAVAVAAERAREQAGSDGLRDRRQSVPPWDVDLTPVLLHRAHDRLRDV